jgi:hypothetical protein
VGVLSFEVTFVALPLLFVLGLVRALPQFPVLLHDGQALLERRQIVGLLLPVLAGKPRLSLGLAHLQLFGVLFASLAHLFLHFLLSAGNLVVECFSPLFTLVQQVLALRFLILQELLLPKLLGQQFILGKLVIRWGFKLREHVLLGCGCPG